MMVGTILEVEQRHLRDAGKWIKSHGEAIFNTTYWYISPQEGEVRFTQTPEAFYMTALSKPNGTLTLSEPVPYVNGDVVTIVGGEMDGKAVPSRLLDGGELELRISDMVRDADHYAWVFKIDYLGNSGCSQRLRNK